MATVAVAVKERKIELVHCDGAEGLCRVRRERKITLCVCLIVCQYFGISIVPWRKSGLKEK